MSASLPAPEPGDAPANEVALRVRFDETDMMGIVHHSRYWSWFEEARFRFMEGVLAVSVADLREQALYMPVVDSRCRYLRSVTWSDALRVRVHMEAAVAARFQFYYDVRLAGPHGQCVALGTTRHVFTDAGMGLKLTVPEFYRAKWATALARFPDAFIDRPPRGLRRGAA